MERYYPVTLNEICMGKVSVQRQGLYYHICCRCRLNADGMYRLVVLNGNNQVNLGILVPFDGAFGLNTKIPQKHIGDGEWIFQLISTKESIAGKFVPISPEEPFLYISRLKESFLTHQNGHPGILVNEKQE